MKVVGMGVALVTGGACRIGAQICRSLANAGHKVIIHYNSSKSEADSLAKELGEFTEVATVKADLGDQDESTNLLSKSIEFFGPIDILINNACYFEYDNIKSFNLDYFNRSIAINTMAPIILSRDFANQVPDTGGVLINILDQKLVNPNPDYLSYTISKTAIAGIIESLAMGLAPSSVRVNGIAPGLTMPSPHASIKSFEEVHDNTPLRRGSTAEDIGDAVLFLVSARAVTGQLIFVDGGERLIPRDKDILYDGGN